MDQKELARSVAADLGPEVLDGVVNPHRGIGEALAIASFIVTCAQLVVEIWRARQDREMLVSSVVGGEELLKRHPNLDAEQRLGLTARVLSKFLPDSFGRLNPIAQSSGLKSRREWVSAYAASRAGTNTRSFVGGATILVPFADQDNWIVFQNVGWIPDQNDGPDVTRVDVPRGFVTDLASVPSYLWALLQKTGKYGNAAIYHDWLYWHQPCCRAVADRVFDRAMHDMGVDAVTRNTMWAGVRVFGGTYWEENQKFKMDGQRRVLKRFPNDPTITWEKWRSEDDVFE